MNLAQVKKVYKGVSGKSYLKTLLKDLKPDQKNGLFLKIRKIVKC